MTKSRSVVPLQQVNGEGDGTEAFLQDKTLYPDELGQSSRGKEHEFVLLSSSEQRRAQDESFRTILLALMEIADVVLDVANFVAYVDTVLLDNGSRGSGCLANSNATIPTGAPSVLGMNGTVVEELEPQSNWSPFAYIYTITTVSVTILSIYVLKGHLEQLLLIRRELRQGIQVEKGRSRVARHNDTGKAGQEVDDEWTLLEFEVVSMERQKARARFIVVSALLEDFVSLGFIAYRIGYTEMIMNECMATCILNENGEADTLPGLCLETTAIIGLLQAASTLTFLAHKLSYLRDYYTLTGILREKHVALNKEGKQDGSVLDTFGPAVVGEQEINAVVEIRRMLRREAHSAGDGLDIRILSFLRACQGDMVETAKRVQMWRTWRNEADLNEVRRRVVLEDWSWDELPHVSKWTNGQPFVGGDLVDDENSCVVFHVYLGANANFDSVFELLSKEEINEAVNYILERTLYFWECTCVSKRRLFSVRILCDARGVPRSEVGILPLAMSVISRAGANVRRYPFKLDILLWQPAPELLTLIREGAPGAMDSIKQVATTAELGTYLSPHVIPEEIGGTLTFGTATDQNDPWQLRQCLCQTLSLSLGVHASDLSFYLDVSSEEVQQVWEMRSLISRLEERCAELRTNGKARLEQEILRYSTELKRYMRKLEVPTMGSDKSVAIAKIRCTVAALQLAKDDVLMEDQPEDVGSNINLLRFLRTNRQVVLEAAASYLEMLVYRRAHKLNKLNAQIKAKNMSLDDLPSFTKMQAIVPVDVLNTTEPSNANIVAIWSVQRLADTKALRGVSPADLEEYFREVHEFMSIAAHRLSEATSFIVSYVTLHLLDRNMSLSTPLKNLQQQRTNFANKYYSGLVNQPEVALTTAPQIMVSGVAELGKYSKAGEVRNLRVVSTKSRDMLMAYLDITRLPVSLGGIVERPERDPANIKYLPQPPLQDFVDKADMGIKAVPKPAE